ncbi:tyrosine-type recombinase/integrase [Acidobacteriota bacterium]
MEKLLNVQEIAQILGCHEQTVYRNQELPIISLPGIGKRCRESDLNTYLEQKSSLFSSNYHKNQPFSLTKTAFEPILLVGGETHGMPKGKNKTRYNFGYGAIYQRKTKQGKIRWYLDYRDGDGKRIQKVALLATTKEEAVIALRKEVQQTFDRKRGVEREKQRLKLKEFSDLFIENYSKVNKLSWKDDLYRLQRINDFFGVVFLDELSPIDIEKFKSYKLKEGVTKTTVNHYLKTLKRMFNIAISWGYATKNPVKEVKFYSERDSQRERILTEEEEDRLLETATEHLRPIIIVALNTGMRRGEILNLKWKDINFHTREILIKKSKSGSPRTLNINSVLFDELTRLKNRDNNQQYVFINPRSGKPYKKLQRSFESARSQAAIEELRFHDLRHTFASRLIERGVDIIKVKEFLGHSTVRTTERYIHPDREERKKALELLCKKPLKTDKNRGNLLHNRYTDKTHEEHEIVSSLFSVN